MLRNSRQRPAIERVHDGVDTCPGGERVAAIAVVAVRPDRVETHAGYEGHVAADLEAPVARAAGIPIIEARRRDLVGNERVAYVGLKHRNGKTEPPPE